MSQFDPTEIHHVAIYPPIGFARVGNSEEKDEGDGWFYAPEVPSRFDTPPNGFKDKCGKVKRQAARFRVYAFDKNNTAIGELNDTTGYSIEWTVHIANKKASWYQFQGKGLPFLGLRNPTHQAKLEPNERTDLIIDPGVEKIQGVNHSHVELVGKFKANQSTAVDVYLGEIFTDQEGRLVVLAGRGKSECIDPTDDGLIKTDFDNPNWYDDTSDGIIQAVVTEKGSNKQWPSEQDSWVFGVPPKFSSAIAAPTTLYDVMENINEQNKRQKPGANYDVGEVQYLRDIEPILRRAVLLSWVNEEANGGHGVGGKGHFLSEKWQKRLANPSKVPAESDFRKNVLNRIRYPDTSEYQSVRNGQSFQYFMPRLSGDGGRTTAGDPTTWTSLTQLQYERLKKWADGDFVLGEATPLFKDIDEFKISERPAKLTQAALEWTIGSPLYPGIEISFNAEDPCSYDGPFRFKKEKFTAGDISKYLSLPWQSDFYMCRNHWWPSARPDQVVPEEVYVQLSNRFEPEEVVKKLTRVNWERGLRPNHTDQYSDQPFYANTDMVHFWSELGFVVPANNIDIDKEPIFIEKQRGHIRGVGKPAPPSTPESSNLLDLAKKCKSCIKTKEDLQLHLQLALQIELTTIPLYLFAMYSIDTVTGSNAENTTGTNARNIIRSVVAEEMLHLSLAGNLLMATGGQPKLYHKDVVPKFPEYLPYRNPLLKLNLRPGTKDNLQTFIDIERPEKKGAPEQPGGPYDYTTLGEYYDEIKNGFDYLSKNDEHLFDNARTECQFTPGLGYSPTVSDAGGLVVVNDLPSACEAIKIIVTEGEGYGGEYDDTDKEEVCHYWKFKNLKEGHASWPVFPVQSNPSTDDYEDKRIKMVSQTFDAAYCFLLKAIEKLFTIGDVQERRKIIFGSMYGTMMGVMAPLADFLVNQRADEQDSVRSAPCFGYYHFETSSPVDELKQLIKDAIGVYEDVQGENGKDVGTQVEALITVQSAIGKLYSF